MSFIQVTLSCHRNSREFYVLFINRLNLQEKFNPQKFIQFGKVTNRRWCDWKIKST
jgi:ribosomal protein L33